MKRLWKGPPFWGKYSDRYMENEGRKDGLLNIPPWKAEHLPPRCWELAQAGDTDAQTLASLWAAEDRILLPAWRQKSHEYENAKDKTCNAKTALETAESAYERARGGKAAPTDRRFTAYWLAVIALGLVEVSLNELVFRVFRAPEIETLVFTAGVTVSIVMSAHFLGVRLHRLRDTVGKLVKKEVALAAILSAVPFGVVFFLAWFRADYLGKFQQSDATPPAPQTLAAGHPVIPALTPAVHIIDLWMLAGLIFFNLLLFTVATVYSYDTHDELQSAIFRLRHEYSAALKGLARAHHALVRARGRRKKRHAHYNALAYRVVANVRRLVDAYRALDLRSRTDRDDHTDEYPDCFKYYGGVAIPKSIHSLDWLPDTDATSHDQTAGGGSVTTDPLPVIPAATDQTTTDQTDHAQQGESYAYVLNGHSPAP